MQEIILIFYLEQRASNFIAQWRNEYNDLYSFFPKFNKRYSQEQ